MYDACDFSNGFSLYYNISYKVRTVSEIDENG